MGRSLKKGPYVHYKLLKKVEDNFKWHHVHPKEPIESIMYRAGQASVVEYIKQLINEE